MYIVRSGVQVWYNSVLTMAKNLQITTGQSTAESADTIQPSLVSKIESEITQQNEASEEKIPQIEVLSWKPRIFVYHNFISDEYCDHIIEVGKLRYRTTSAPILACCVFRV